VRVGADTGGTFTDVVDEHGAVTKVPSSPEDPGDAVREGVEGLGRGRPRQLAHGSTVATNALLERRGARVALITTEGFADLIEIGRQNRPSLYDLWADRPVPLVARGDRLEVGGRLAADGAELAPLDTAGMPALDDGLESVAVCLLHADLDPRHEQQLADELRRRGITELSVSSEVSPEYREYERTITTVIDAYVRPRCRTYLNGLGSIADEVLVMTSAGGLVPVDVAARHPVAFLLSGPAAGVRAAAAVGVQNGYPDVLTFDMGGTSTDVCLVLEGRPEPAAQRSIGGFGVRYPSLDIHTIGAGGGSIASVDAGGALTVGPQSAGAVPGPACYGRGGELPAVTDANVLLGRIPADASFGGLTLDPAAAAAACDRAGVDPLGVIRVVNANMEQALRTVSVERGVDPAGLALVAFGGAGPLHACDLADALGITTVLIPARAGVLSAVGLLASSPQRVLVRSWRTPADLQGLDRARVELGEEVRGLLDHPQAVVGTTIDVRYVGQSHELTVADVDEFHREHQRRNGYARPDAPVEVLAIRAEASGPPLVDTERFPDLERSQAVGPAVIAEPDCTIWVPEGWRSREGAQGALVLERAS
jgi:N-methylhydantoinase A/oxoprolinase/acetone carboxylase beta subunit